ncbi:MAG: class I SAM-dependent methyltransferase [Candidatus Kerfeldbacteria bacterium]|nr:class I SAM-dependent methyltransferase [Candidatus Kerfeldbacteria bacterium]
MTKITDRHYLDPESILRQVKLGPRMRVGDFGCGGGCYFSIAAAQQVGEKGMVYAVDVFKPALSACQSKARLANLATIKLVWSDLEVFRGARTIPDNSLDLGLIVNTLHQSRKRNALFKETMRMVKPGGTMLVIDWELTGFGFGPEKNDLVPAEEVERLAQEAGLRKTGQFQPSRYHYALVFEKKNQESWIENQGRSVTFHDS